MSKTFSHQRAAKKNKETGWLMIIRILLACVFIFAGLTKIIDPVASGIKMDEYFISFGMEFMHPFSLWLGILMNIAEFTLGFMLLFRIRVKLTTLGFLLFMVFFFFLTAWLAIAEHLEVNYGYNFNVVKDCGCFGHAISMSNMETFLKNVALMIVTLLVFAKRNDIPDIRLTLLGQWLFACVGAGISLFLQYYFLTHLPIIDNSNWKKGKNVIELFVEKPAEIEILFEYQNAKGEEMFLTMDEMGTISETIPNFYSAFDYVDRIDSVMNEAVKPEMEGFSMLDEQGRDWTNIYLNENRENLYILFMHDLDEVDERGIKSENLQKLISECISKDIDFVGITNSSPEKITEFKEKYNLTFPIYHNPINPIKGPFIVRDAIRSNPGLILLQHGIVAQKIPWRKF